VSTSTVLLALAVFGACAVEAVEALTIVLAAGTRSWRSALEGAALAVATLAVIVSAVGIPLIRLVPIDTLRVVIGALLLVVGLQWLRKAILRASGIKALHDEDAIYEQTVQELWAIRDCRVLRSTEFAVTWPVAPSEGVGFIGVVVGGGSRVKDRSGAARPTAHRWHCGHCVELRIDTERTGDCDRRPGESHRAGGWSPAPEVGRWDQDVGVTVSGWGGAGRRHAGGGPHRQCEDDQEDDDHAFTASARAWCSRIRHEGPLMLNTTARCMRRSRIAPATTASPKTSPQAGKPRLVVARVGWPFS